MIELLKYIGLNNERLNSCKEHDFEIKEVSNYIKYECKKCKGIMILNNPIGG